MTQTSMSPEEFRRMAHRVVDWIADYRTSCAQRPVQSATKPGDLLAQLPLSPPATPEGFEAVLHDVDALLLPALSHWQHPDFFAYFPSNGDLASVLGDFLSTGLGVLGLAWQSAPALTELEERAVDWLRQMLGLSASWSGVIQDTASTSTLVGLICARERTSQHAATRGGMQSNEPPLVVYTSADAHSSVDKRASIEQDLAAGRRPCAIVATTGTTTTTAMDPIADCAEIAREYGIWLHVDGAMAGSAMILPECRHLWHGIEGADSIVVNPHKWLGVAFDCSIYFVRDQDHLVRVMSTNPSYLRTDVDDRVKNYRDWGIPLGRRFRALKLWSLIRTHGTERLQERLRRDLENTRWLAEQIAATAPWRVLAPVQLQTVCVRHEPAGVTGDNLDRHTLEWLRRVHATGRAWLTPAQLDGRWMVRISIGALDTEREHVAQLWQDLQAATR
jgi:aromatic-L-amino-acid/L-tryptophan decarboxylase